MPKIIVLVPFKFAHNGHQVEEFAEGDQPVLTSPECAHLAIAEGWALDADKIEAEQAAAEQAAAERAAAAQAAADQAAAEQAAVEQAAADQPADPAEKAAPAAPVNKDTAPKRSTKAAA